MTAILIVANCLSSIGKRNKQIQGLALLLLLASLLPKPGAGATGQPTERSQFTA